MVDPRSDVPAWKQLAALLRARIESGEWAPGSLLPSQQRIGHEHGVGKATVEQAVRSLRTEGLVDLERGIGLRVREPVERRRVAVPRYAVISSRMPTAAERAELDVPEGVPLMLVYVGGRLRGVYPADRVDLTTA